MKVRRASVRDAEVIARMAAAASAADGLPPPGLDQDLVRAHAFGANPLFEAWVAEDLRGAPIGCAIAARGYDIQRACATLAVLALFVAEGARRGGLARQIIAAVSARAMELGARELMIETGVDNAAARRFFAAIGAEEVAKTQFTLGRDQIEWLTAEQA